MLYWLWRKWRVSWNRWCHVCKCKRMHDYEEALGQKPTVAHKPLLLRCVSGGLDSSTTPARPLPITLGARRSSFWASVNASFSSFFHCTNSGSLCGTKWQKISWLQNGAMQYVDIQIYSVAIVRYFWEWLSTGKVVLPHTAGQTVCLLWSLAGCISCLWSVSLQQSLSAPLLRGFATENRPNR